MRTNTIINRFVTITLAIFLITTSAWSQTHLPEWSLNYQGDSISSKDLDGKVVIFAFWATWCPPCLAEIPTLKSLQSEFGPQGLQIVGLSVDRDALAHDDLVQNKKLNYPSFPVASSTGGSQLTSSLQKAINKQINSIPTLIFVDKQGKVVSHRVGLTDHDVLKAEIQALLK